MPNCWVETGAWVVSISSSSLCAALAGCACLSGRSKSDWILGTGVIFVSLVTVAVLVCGLLGMLHPVPVAACHFCALLAICVTYWRRGRLRVHAERCTGRLLSFSDLSRLDALLASGLACFLALFVFRVLSDHKASFDALVYHLTLAATWVRNGSLGIDDLAPGLMHYSFPANASLGFSWLMLAAKSNALVPMWGLLWALLGTVALYRVSRLCGCSRALASVSALMFIGMDNLHYTTGNDTVDGIFAGALLCTVASVMQFHRTRRPFWGVIAGLSAGLMWGTKPSGFVYAGLLSLALAVVLWRLLRSRLIGARRALVGAAGFAASLTALGAYWPIRNLVRSGSFSYPSGGYGSLLPTTIVANMHVLLGSIAGTRRFEAGFAADCGPFLAYVAVPGGVAGGILLLGVLLARRRVTTDYVSFSRCLLTMLAVAALCAWFVQPFSARHQMTSALLWGGDVRYALGAVSLAGVLCVVTLACFVPADPLAAILFALAARSAAIGDPSGKVLRSLPAIGALVISVAVVVRRARAVLTHRATYVAIVVASLVPALAAPRLTAELSRASERAWQPKDDLQAAVNMLPSRAVVACVGVGAVYPYFGKDFGRRLVFIGRCSSIASRRYGAPAWRASGTNLLATPGREDVWLSNLAEMGPEYVVATFGDEWEMPEIGWMERYPGVFQPICRPAGGRVFRVDQERLSRLLREV